MVMAIMRIYSYVFHALLSLFLLGLGAIAYLSGYHSVRLDLLPWTGRSLTYWLLALGVAGILIVLLAFKGVLRVLFVLWTLLIAGALIRGYFLSPYYFGSAQDFWWGMAFFLGAVVTVIGAWSRYRQKALSRF